MEIPLVRATYFWGVWMVEIMEIPSFIPVILDKIFDSDRFDITEVYRFSDFAVVVAHVTNGSACYKRRCMLQTEVHGSLVRAGLFCHPAGWFAMSC